MKWNPGDNILNHIVRNPDGSYDYDVYADFGGILDDHPVVDIKFSFGSGSATVSMLTPKELRRLAEFLVAVANEVDDEAEEE